MKKPQYSQIVEVPVEAIEIEDGRKRESYGDIEGLAEDIFSNGLINPILVKKSDDRIVLVAGERRLIASKMLGLDYVQCRVVADHDDTTELEVSENTRRAPFAPLEIGNIALDMMSKAKTTRSKLARRLGVSAYHLSKCIKVASYVRDHPESKEDIQRRLSKRGGLSSVLQTISSSGPSASPAPLSGPLQPGDLLVLVADEGIGKDDVSKASDECSRHGSNLLVIFRSAYDAIKREGDASKFMFLTSVFTGVSISLGFEPNSSEYGMMPTALEPMHIKGGWDSFVAGCIRATEASGRVVFSSDTPECRAYASKHGGYLK